MQLHLEVKIMLKRWIIKYYQIFNDYISKHNFHILMLILIPRQIAGLLGCWLMFRFILRLLIAEQNMIF